MSSYRMAVGVSLCALLFYKCHSFFFFSFFSADLPGQTVLHVWHNDRQDAAPLWCGKAYQPEWPARDPGERMILPELLPDRILDVRCFSRMNVYLHGEAEGEIVVELSSTDLLYDRRKSDDQHIYLSEDDSGSLNVCVTDGGCRKVALPVLQTLRLNFTIDLAHISSGHLPLHLVCSVADDASRTISSTVDFYHLPPREDVSGSFSRVDQLTGLIMVNSSTKGEPLESWVPVVPVGFYNVPRSLPDMIKYGYNVLHIVPGLPTEANLGYGDNYSALVSEAAELGIWVMHDMRWSWQHDDLLRDQILKLRNASNLLTWYTGDEPDGTSENPTAFQRSTELVRDIDSRYHVISSAFNCADYAFKEYTRDIDIIMTDPYPIGLYSSGHGRSIYGTVCNATYGCCGCDDCHGTISDIATRIELFRSYLEVLDRQAVLWLIPQGFGNELHWTRFPSTEEVLAMHMIACNHGVTGFVSWIYNEKAPEFERVRTAVSTVAVLIASVTDLLYRGHRVSIDTSATAAALDLAVWQNKTHILVSAVNHEDARGQDTVVHISSCMHGSVNHILGGALLFITSHELLIRTHWGLATDVWLIECL